MTGWARAFGEYIAAVSGGVGVVLTAALIVLALSRITFPTLRQLWHHASPLGRLFGVLLFLVCSINATTKAPVRKAATRSTVSAALSGATQLENWFRRGAWRDSYYLKFDTDWVFPHGTNHFSGIWLYSFGALAAPLTRKTFAAFGTELALFPEESEVTWERTASNTYHIVWQNAFPDRRGRENTISAAFELFRNGNIVITTNNVTRHIERELPFNCTGHGQDADWIAANYPNEQDEIAEAGSFAAWVEKRITEDPYNGYYALTVSCDAPLEGVCFTVGEKSVYIEEAGEYVFLLEKGREYELAISATLPNVSYDYTTPLAKTRRLLRATSKEPTLQANGSQEKHLFTAPSETNKGLIFCLPALIITQRKRKARVFLHILVVI